MTAFGDRIITFKEPIPNKVLKGYVIGRERVPNEGSCRVNCYLNPDCVSINTGPLKEGELTCELNAAASGNEYSSRLEYQESHTYSAVQGRREFLTTIEVLMSFFSSSNQLHHVSNEFHESEYTSGKTNGANKFVFHWLLYHVFIVSLYSSVTDIEQEDRWYYTICVRRNKI